MKKVVKAKTGRKCTVCTHKKVGHINKQLAEGVSFRNILERTGLTLGALHRHTENCLKLDLQTVHEEKKVEQAFDFAAELNRLYAKANKMVEAIERWLVDPENAEEFDIGPRDVEILVVYLDHNDLNEHRKPRRKKGTLADLLDRAEAGNITVQGVASMAMDNRKLYLEAFKTLNDRLEQMAKFHGLFVQKTENTVNINVTRVVEPDALEAEFIG